MDAGQRLGRYELVRRLGRGGSGDVWEAVLHGPAGFQKSVALKLLHTVDRDGQETLLHEARIGALLQHPNVVSTLDLAPVEGGWAMAMELVRGAALSDLVRVDILGPAAALEAGMQACAGLQHIHALNVGGRSAGLVHRDIKPQNLLVDHTGMVKVADLGIARIRGSAGGIAGTPGYMAPEQVDGAAEARSDLFALGATLYALMSGEKPFGRGTEAMLRVRRVEALLRRKDFLAPLEQVATGLGDVIRGCLREDPAERWASAAELASELARLRVRVGPGETLAERLAQRRPDLTIESTASGHSWDSEHATVQISRGNLPAERDRFFGRSAETSALVRRIEAGERLITLMGPGGMGKTRLALQAARTLEQELGGGAWFFDLSEAKGKPGLCFAVAQGLGVVLDRGDPVDQVGYALRGLDRTVVVLDNLEQVAEPAATVVSRWLELAPETSFVCTSRIALKIQGEGRVPVGPLDAETGLALFEDRSPGQLDEAGKDAVRALISELDGMPLAVELAAARSRLMSPTQLRSRLSERLRLLSGGDRDRPDRQRSLRASLDGSWSLLSEDGQLALAQLSVFDGGFSLAAAEAVVELPGGGWVLDALEELVDASLLRTIPDNDRFGMLVVVQAYATEKLREPGPARERHARSYAQLGSDEAIRALTRPGGEVRVAELLRDLDNLVTATRFAVDSRWVDIAVPLVAAVSEGFANQGPLDGSIPLLETTRALPGLSERDAVRLTCRLAAAHASCGRGELALELMEGLLDRALALEDRQLVGIVQRIRSTTMHRLGRTREGCDAVDLALQWVTEAHDPQLRADLLTRRAEFSITAGDMELVPRLNAEAEALLERTGDVAGLAMTVRTAGNWFLNQGRNEEALEHYRRSVSLERRAGRHRQATTTLANMGIVLTQLGRIDEGRSHYEQALATTRRLGDRTTEGMVMANLGALERDIGRLDDAEQWLRQALAIHQEVGDRRLEGVTASNLGVTMLDRGDLEQARDYYEVALEVHREVGARRSEGIALIGLSGVHGRLGDLELAQKLAEEGLAASREVGNLRFVGYAYGRIGSLALERGDIDGARERWGAAKQLATEIGNRRMIANMDLNLAVLDRRSGDLQGAQERLLAAQRIFGEINEERGIAQTHAALAEVHADAGRTEAAIASAHEALSASEDVDAHEARERAQAVLDTLDQGKKARTPK